MSLPLTWNAGRGRKTLRRDGPSLAFDQAGGPTVNDTVRTDLQATYSRELTRDWQFTTGYEYRMRDEENVGSDTSNRFFLTFEREFVVRP